jgi:hypothetical protein
MIQTSKITQPSQYSGIIITNLSNNATINITPFTKLETLNVSSTNNNISSTELNFNNFSKLETLLAEASARSSSNPGISFNVNGTNSSVKNYTAQSSVVTSLVLKNPTFDYALGINVGEIPKELTVLNIEGNALTGQDLASILCSFSGMAKNNNITGGDINVIPYNNLGQSLTPHFPNSIGYYRDLWSSYSGRYQLAAQLQEGEDKGYIRLSTNFGIDFTTIFNRDAWRSVAASDNLDRIVAVARQGKAYLSTNSGITFSAINTGLTNNKDQNYTDAAMSSNGQYINLTINGNPNTDYVSTGALYCSSDYGATFTKKGPAFISGDITARWASVGISSNGQYQIASTNNGTHRWISTSSDFGENWTARQVGNSFTDVAISSDGRYQTVAGDYIWTSSNYGVNWNLAYRDYSKISKYYYIANTDFSAGASVSSDGKFQIVGLSTTAKLIPAYPYIGETSGYLVTSSNYGATWQRTNFRDKWGSVNISPNAEYIMAGSQVGLLYTSLTNGADTTYGTYLSSAYGATQYLRNVKNWTVKFIRGLFNI